MGWRLVRQPNGLLAMFSDIVDDFTAYDMTDEEAFIECRDKGGVDVARQKIQRANEHPERFDDEIETIELIHGKAEAEKRRKELSVKQ